MYEHPGTVADWRRCVDFERQPALHRRRKTGAGRRNNRLAGKPQQPRSETRDRFRRSILGVQLELAGLACLVRLPVCAGGNVQACKPAATVGQGVDANGIAVVEWYA